VKRVAVFVDGFNLYHGMHEAFGRKYLWLDLQALSLSLLKPLMNPRSDLGFRRCRAHSGLLR
jgi:hypothetical protein